MFRGDEPPHHERRPQHLLRYYDHHDPDADSPPVSTTRQAKGGSLRSFRSGSIHGM